MTWLTGSGLVDLGVALLLIVALAEFAKVKRKSERGYNWLAASGMLMLFAGGTEVMPATIPYIQDLFLTQIFSLAGWVFALIGALFILYETLLER
jgi:hypothetical protein